MQRSRSIQPTGCSTIVSFSQYCISLSSSTSTEVEKEQSFRPIGIQQANGCTLITTTTAAAILTTNAFRKIDALEEAEKEQKEWLA